MKKYKHIPTKDIVGEVENQSGYYRNINIPDGQLICGKYIIGCKDWEEIKEYDFITEDGVGVNKATTVYWTQNKYESGKYIGEYRYSYALGVVEGHRELLKNGHVYKIFSTQKAAIDFCLSTIRKSLFTTEDGVEIFDEKQQLYDTSTGNWNFLGITEAKYFTNILKRDKNRKAWYSENKAQEYINNNEPKYSLQMVKDICNGKDFIGTDFLIKRLIDDNK